MKRFLLIATLLLAYPSAALTLDDTLALTGLSAAPIIYDVRTDAPEKLLFILKTIGDTRKSLQAQGVASATVVSMRGPTVKLLVANSALGTPESRERLAAVVAGMVQEGVRLEACGYALNLFALDPGDLFPGVVAIGNSLISLAGYQAKGYALVTMN